MSTSSLTTPLELAKTDLLTGIVVIRPADGRETAASLNLAFNSKNTPFVLALSRQNLPQLENSSRNIYRGAYIIKKEEGELEKNCNRYRFRSFSCP